MSRFTERAKAFSFIRFTTEDVFTLESFCRDSQGGGGNEPRNGFAGGERVLEQRGPLLPRKGLFVVQPDRVNDFGIDAALIHMRTASRP